MRPAHRCGGFIVLPKDTPSGHHRDCTAGCGGPARLTRKPNLTVSTAIGLERVFLLKVPPPLANTGTAGRISVAPGARPRPVSPLGDPAEDTPQLLAFSSGAFCCNLFLP